MVKEKEQTLKEYCDDIKQWEARKNIAKDKINASLSSLSMSEIKTLKKGIEEYNSEIRKIKQIIVKIVIRENS